jgi:hypothetical protein
VAAQIRTPIFFVNAAYDSWQVRILFLKKHQFIFGLVFFWYGISTEFEEIDLRYKGLFG